jgi:hypothetical protein
MEIQQLDILLRLVIAHLLADFVFQKNPIANEKNNGSTSRHFYVHIFKVGIITYALLPGWNQIAGPIIIMLTHGLIDWGNSKIKKDTIWLFILDQALHILTLVVFWILVTNNSWTNILAEMPALLFHTNAMIIIIAYLTATMPVGYLIGYLTKRWQDEIHGAGSKSLKDAGKWIGMIERILALTFILLQQWSAIGFLLAAKSVFRFGDIKDRTQQKKTEYILIGTFLSFAFSIALGILAHSLLISVQE